MSTNKYRVVERTKAMGCDYRLQTLISDYYGTGPKWSDTGMTCSTKEQAIALCDNLNHVPVETVIYP